MLSPSKLRTRSNSWRIGIVGSERVFREQIGMTDKGLVEVLTDFVRLKDDSTANLGRLRCEARVALGLR
jgi:hypothetical protein